MIVHSHRFAALIPILPLAVLAAMAALGFGGADAGAATIAVPADQPTIQAAIDSASPFDTVAISPGVYNETLVIDKSVTLIGSGASSTFIYHDVASPLVTVSNSDVAIRDLELNGGTPWVGGDLGWFWGFSARGIVSEESDLLLEDLVINQFSNYAVTVNGGSIAVNNVALQAQSRYKHQCDVGFQLNSCIATFDGLASQSGWIDHTININNPPASFSQVDVTNSTIVSSEQSWGDGIRAYSDTTLYVADSNFDRPPGGAPAAAPNHTGISINGFNVDATIARNHFTGVPYGVVVHGSLPDSNAVTIAGCTFENVENSAVYVQDLDYAGLDLGGGALGSVGNNQFANSGDYEVELQWSTADVSALGNSWGAPDADAVIWDGIDDPALGYVIVGSTSVPALSPVAQVFLVAGIVAGFRFNRAKLGVCSNPPRSA